MGTEREFDALAADAIASSEKEFFAEAMGHDEAVADETGDRSLEDMGSGLEGQHEAGDDENEDAEAAAEAEAAKAEADAQEAAAQRDDKGRFQQQAGKTETPAERGLRTELTGERDKRRTIESENAELKNRLAAIEARLAQPQPVQQPVKPQDQQPQKDEAPDRWTDPEGYDNWHRERILNEVRAESQKSEQRRVAWSFEEAKAKHGDDFTEAYKIANALPASDPVAKQLIDTILQSANPGERLMAWHRQQAAVREIGNDPAAYRVKVEADARAALMKDPEFRKQVFGELQGEARGDGNPRNTIKLPPSLNSARGGSLNRGAAGGTSDADIFSEIMS